MSSNLSKESMSIARDLRNATRHDPDGKYDSKVLRRVAERLFELRSTYVDPEGRPDLTGRSWAYRQELGDILGAANLSPDLRPKITALLRYYMSQVLRERMTEGELEEYGLQPEHSLDRQREARKAKSRFTRAVRSGDRITDGGEFYDALQGVTFLLTNVDLTAFTGDDLARVAKRLGVVEQSAGRLRKACQDYQKG